MLVEIGRHGFELLNLCGCLTFKMNKRAADVKSASGHCVISWTMAALASRDDIM